jgi:hypothetical protein
MNNPKEIEKTKKEVEDRVLSLSEFLKNSSCKGLTTAEEKKEKDPSWWNVIIKKITMIKVIFDHFKDGLTKCIIPGFDMVVKVAHLKETEEEKMKREKEEAKKIKRRN